MRFSFKSDYKKTFNLTKALVAATSVRQYKNVKLHKIFFEHTIQLRTSALCASSWIIFKLNEKLENKKLTRG